MNRKFFIIANYLQNEDATPVIQEVNISPTFIEMARINGESDEEVISAIIEAEVSFFVETFDTLVLSEKDFEALKEKLKNM